MAQFVIGRSRAGSTDRVGTLSVSTPGEQSFAIAWNVLGANVPFILAGRSLVGSVAFVAGEQALQVTRAFTVEWNALSNALPTTPINTTYGLAWNVRTVAANSASAAWNVYRAVNAPVVTLLWDVYSHTNISRPITWHVQSLFNDVAQNYSHSWHVREALLQTRIVRWNVGAVPQRHVEWPIKKIIIGSLAFDTVKGTTRRAIGSSRKWKLPRSAEVTVLVENSTQFNTLKNLARGTMTNITMPDGYVIGQGVIKLGELPEAYYPFACPIIVLELYGS